jgi:hypothetical protein
VARYRVEYPPGEPRELDAQTVEQLRALGYID